MDEQERPTDEAEGSAPSRTNSGLLVIGVVFLVVGITQLVGPGDGGVAFIVIGVVFLATGGVRLRR